MNRRRFLGLLALAGASLSGCRFYPAEGMSNPCLKQGLPPQLRDHELLRQCWEGIDARQFWDCHVHLAGTGDSDSGIWVNPDMRSPWHPIQYTQFRYYLDAACVDGNELDSPGGVDAAYVERLRHLHRDFPPEARFMLLAFDYYHDGNGRKNAQMSAFHVPNSYAQRVAAAYPGFEWIASIHPYREDSVEALAWCARHGARAVKWLPGAMGIDPASPRCDRFYAALVRHDIPLLSHTGKEYAISVEGGQALNNPLRLRRPLEHGVRVILAHCASLGEYADIDRGEDGPQVDSLSLFHRLAAERRYAGRIFGDLSAVTLVNRARSILERLWGRSEFHGRMINGSDYPLPGIMPLISTQGFVDWGFLAREEAGVLVEVRRYNPLLYDFMLKRRLSIGGVRLPSAVFHSRRIFQHA